MKREYDLIAGDKDNICSITVDGESVQAFKGETLLSTLSAIGRRSISKNDENKICGAFCGMGICYTCTVTINGRSNCRACQVYVEEDMEIRTQHNVNYTDNSDIK